MGPLTWLVALAAGAPLAVSVYKFVKRFLPAGAGELHPRLAVLPAAAQRAITSWLRTAQPNDPLVVFTGWNEARLAQLNTNQQAVIQLLLANGASATACPSCVYFSGNVQMNRCRLALRAHANYLFGFSNPLEEQAMMRRLQAAAAPPIRVGDTLTVYCASHRAVELDSDMQFFG